MKRRDLIRRAERSGCEFLRESGNHTVYSDAGKTRLVFIPRHREINEKTAREILKQLGVRDKR